MAEDDFEAGMGVEHAGQHKADTLRRGLDRKAPGRAQDARVRLRIILVIGVDDRLLRQRRVDVDRDVERGGAFLDRPEPLVVVEEPSVSPLIIAPLKPSPVTVRSSSSAAARGSAVGRAAKAAKRSG